LLLLLSCVVLPTCIYFGLRLTFDEDFQQCPIPYYPPGADVRFRDIARNIQTIADQDKLLTEPEPWQVIPAVGPYCGCARGTEIRVYGTDRSIQQVSDTFKQAMTIQSWQTLGDNAFQNPTGTTELTIARTDPHLPNVWDYSWRFIAPTPTADPAHPLYDKSWEQFRTIYLVKLAYAEPTMKRCYGG
jgi:hypothetical protein